MGRKTLYGARRNVTVYLTDEEYEQVREKAHKLNTSMASILHEILLGMDKTKEELIEEITVLKSKVESQDTEEKEISLDEITKRFVEALKAQGFFEAWAKKPYVPIDSMDNDIKSVLVNMGKNPSKGNVTRVKTGIKYSYDEWKREYNLKNINVSYIYHGKNQDYPDDGHSLLKQDVDTSQAQNAQKNSIKVMP